MTKKHFIALANAFRETRPGKMNTARYLQWQSDLFAVVAILRADNPRFDAERFSSVVYSE